MSSAEVSHHIISGVARKVAATGLLFSAAKGGDVSEIGKISAFKFWTSIFCVILFVIIVLFVDHSQTMTYLSGLLSFYVYMEPVIQYWYQYKEKHENLGLERSLSLGSLSHRRNAVVDKDNESALNDARTQLAIESIEKVSKSQFILSLVLILIVVVLLIMYIGKMHGKIDVEEVFTILLIGYFILSPIARSDAFHEHIGLHRKMKMM